MDNKKKHICRCHLWLPEGIVVVITWWSLCCQCQSHSVFVHSIDSSITINIVSTKQVRKDAQNISPETIGSEFRIMQRSSGFQGYKNLRGNMLHLKKHGIRMDQTIRDMAAKISPLLSFTHGCHVRKISLAWVTFLGRWIVLINYIPIWTSLKPLRVIYPC